MRHSISRSFGWLGTVALVLASIPFRAARADDTKVAQAPGNAKDLGVMGVNLRDAVKLNYGFQGALQGAGTPNQAGIGAFVPLKVNQNSIWFLDATANANFGDYSGYSSIGDTTVVGTTISTSTRLGYRWLNGDRSWMYGINAGYDTRPMATGGTTSGLPVSNSQTIFFQQVAINAEARNNKWNASVFGLIPVGEYGMNSGKVAQINEFYGADPLTTVGIDVGYKLTPALTLTAGYYYQTDCKDESTGFSGTADGSGIKTHLAYDITQGLQAGVSYSYDENFQSRVSADLRWRFGGGNNTKKSQSPISPVVIQALTTTPANRDVRVANSVKGAIQVFGCLFIRNAARRSCCIRSGGNAAIERLLPDCNPNTR